MGQRTKGKCKCCGKEYTMSYKSICSKHNRNYWMFIEIRDTVTLKDLDRFLRDIWLECCGHLSAFNINGVTYDVDFSEDSFFGRPVKSMDCSLKSVLKKDMAIEYEYDFGSTTELIITVVDFRTGYREKESHTILSRNNPPVFLCSECGKKEAKLICMECVWEGFEGFLCEECSRTHACGEDMLMNVCNSPRMGVCGYQGSDIYPDQFVPDTEKV